MQSPEKGFYYHYKHDDSIGFDHHAYEVCGLSRHTEDESYLVRYRPLYVAPYLEEADQYIRPLSLWFNDVEWNGTTVPRFTRITDPVVVEKLTRIKQEMYDA